MAPDNLKAESLEWALKHLEEHGDTDFLPLPFEVGAMRAAWSGLKATLAKVDVGDYTPSNPLLVLAPKGDAAFRAVKQLSPFDSIIYAALAYEAAEAIEKLRQPVADGRVFSYRVSMDAKGRLWDPNVTWRSFHARSEEIVADTTYSHVVIADIADFYNHIYLHRVRNALEAAGVNETRSKNIEAFLVLPRLKRDSLHRRHRSGRRRARAPQAPPIVHRRPEGRHPSPSPRRQGPRVPALRRA